jgi:integrase
LISEIVLHTTGEPLRFYTVEDWLCDWLKGKEVAKSKGTFYKYKYTIENFLTSLGDRAKRNLNQITPRDIQRFRDAEREAGKHPRTCNFAVDLDQVKAILKAAKGDWRGAIMIALYTGARLQDVTDMSWESVDLQNKWIAFRAGKTRQRIKIPIHDSLHDYLLELPAPDSGKAFLFPTLAGKRTDGKSSLSMAFKRIMERAKVNGEVVHERGGAAGRTVSTLSFHSFRHTLTNIMANAGVPVEVRQKFTGHASAEMNASYTHHEIETLRSAIGKLPALRH